MDKRTLILIGLVALFLGGSVWGIVHAVKSSKAHKEQLKHQEESAAKELRLRQQNDSLDRESKKEQELREDMKHVADSLGLSLEQVKLWQDAIKNRRPLPSAVAYRDSILRTVGLR